MSGAPVERLDTGPGARGFAEELAALGLAERAGEARPFVFCNFVSSVDGRASLEGSTRELGSDADTELLLELRAAADAVLVGTGTIAAEGYARLVGAPARVHRRRAAGLPGTPLAVVFSRSGRIPWDAGLFAAADQPVLVVTGPAGTEVPTKVAAPVEVVALPAYDLAAALALLRRRGVRALLCEGGPTLFAALLRDDLVDELFLTVAPLLTGDDDEPRIVTGAELAGPVALRLESVLRSGHELFLRYSVDRG